MAATEKQTHVVELQLLPNQIPKPNPNPPTQPTHDTIQGKHIGKTNTNTHEHHKPKPQQA